MVWAVADPADPGADPAEPTSVEDERDASRRGLAHLGLVVGVALVIIALDQLSKTWALRRLAGRPPIDVVGSLRFTLTWNTGTAFSLGDDLNLGPVIAVVALAVVGWLLWAGYSARPVGALAAGLVAGGAVGNLADRAFRTGPRGAPVGFMGGAVVDFIDLQWWPIFNVADAGIVVGALLLVVVSAREPEGSARSAGDR